MFSLRAIRYAVAALALFTPATLTACGGSSPSAPQSLPTIGALTTPRDQPSGPPPAPTETRNQAELSVVRRYFQASNSLTHQMDPSALSVLFTASCPCRAQVRSVRRAHRDGQRFVGRATVNALRASPDGPSQATVLADYDFSRGGVEAHDGTRLSTTAPKTHIRWTFRLTLVDRQWLIARIDTIG